MRSPRGFGTSRTLSTCMDRSSREETRMRRNTLTHVVAALAIAFGGLGVATATVTATAPTAHADECYSWPRTLGSGASGADVTQLQVRVAGWVPRGQVMGVDGSF